VQKGGTSKGKIFTAFSLFFLGGGITRI